MVYVGIFDPRREGRFGVARGKFAVEMLFPKSTSRFYPLAGPPLNQGTIWKHRRRVESGSPLRRSLRCFSWANGSGLATRIGAPSTPATSASSESVYKGSVSCVT
jgi:hypothetical protein